MSQIEDRLDSQNVAYVERLLDIYQRDPAQVPAQWRDYFQQHGAASGNGQARFAPSFRPASLFNPPPLAADGRHLAAAQRQDRVSQLIRAYRVRGHLAARLDPLGIERPEPPELALAFHRLREADLERSFSTASLGGPGTQTLRDIVERLRTTYCRYIGAQFMHIDELEVRDWLAERMEQTQNRLALSREEQLEILTRLTDAVIFEQFVRKKYIGAKTFSLEGAESLIPLLDLAIEKAARQGINEIVMGMAHRGRLNVLANIIGKTPREIFWEFADPHRDEHRGAGDVKYHLGFSGDWQAAGGRNVHLSLCFNPSHLEFINPVALGRMRAKQDRAGDHQRRQGMVLLIHGDAAFAGEGVIQETLNLSQLAAYTTGGTLHVIVNNQIGFTTSPAEGRSTTYATDVAKMLQIPIFHVNGEDPEAVAQVVELAFDFREKFRRDVVIDMYGYRRWGHNEGDEPSFTQPVLYRAIQERPPVRDAYLAHLLNLEGVTREEADRIAQERHQQLEQEFKQVQQAEFDPKPQTLTGNWQGYRGGREPEDDQPQTGVDAKRLSELLLKLSETPADFHLHPKLQRIVERRRQMAAGDQPLDWSAAEALALATLSLEGHPVRLTGQDSVRGTFSQRHAVLYDAEDGRPHEVYQHLAQNQAPVQIVNGPLCETGDLGFQYGYSLDYPEALVLWEAQYGDFANAAQVVIDQFLVSAEDKWRRLSGLVLLLPHGFEGGGPEHSSARLERFLGLAAEDNIQIAVPTTPAQYFHLLRRQVKRRWRKPLVIMTPKSLLRHPQAVSALEDFSPGRTFQRIISTGLVPGDSQHALARVLLCSGKMYYELLAAGAGERPDLALVRIEQLYPRPEKELSAALAPVPDGVAVVWVQEEPENMGAWPYWRQTVGDRLFDRFPLAGIARSKSASPATGSSAAHKREQQELIDKALASVSHQSPRS
ncbi:MAG TPA: 2-oxoglutarate dehydrogenase E1 component [Pirellulaceae bacterium]|nr:2-oxoglutarate dehydrogenase E1 component [Pirellulaceae bacterium]